MITENNYKYPKAPTIEQIDAVVKKAGISESQFERYNGIYYGAIRQVRCGFREMPSKHWHIFLEPSQPLVSRNRSKIPQNKPKNKQAHRKTESLSSLVS